MSAYDLKARLSSYLDGTPPMTYGGHIHQDWIAGFREASNEALSYIARLERVAEAARVYARRGDVCGCGGMDCARLMDALSALDSPPAC